MADNNKNNPNPNELNIELPEEISEGVYSNLAIITHSPSEFVIDFVRMMPGVPKAKVKSRIILTPQHAKRLMKALIDNVQKFEAMHGEIKDIDAMGLPMNLGPNAQAQLLGSSKFSYIEFLLKNSGTIFFICCTISLLSCVTNR